MHVFTINYCRLLIIGAQQEGKLLPVYSFRRFVYSSSSRRRRQNNSSRPRDLSTHHEADNYTAAAGRKCSSQRTPLPTQTDDIIMPTMGFRSSCKKLAKEAIRDVVAKAEYSPRDPEAYAAQVAETIKADVRYVV